MSNPLSEEKDSQKVDDSQVLSKPNSEAKEEEKKDGNFSTEMCQLIFYDFSLK